MEKNNFKKKYLLLSILAFLFFGNFAESQNLNLNWKKPIDIYFDSHESIKAIYFENAKFDQFVSIPYYSLELGIFQDNNFDFQVEIENPTFTELSSDELIIFQKSNFSASENLIFNIISSSINKNNKKEIHFYPFIICKDSGKIKKLISGEIIVAQNYNPNKFEFSNKTKYNKTNTSVLSSGSFYKISVNQPGIYKISFSDLQAMGINVQSINPKNLRIYGNGGQMLPEKNDEPRIDDLYENSIFVFGENDGVFNNGDYILFYATGPNTWTYDSISQTYKHRNNKYEDKSYYFLNFNKGPGKRISTVNNMSEVASITNTIFLDKAHHETEQFNLIHSGKEWFGEVFDINLNQSFSFSFPNAISDSCIKIDISFAARAPGNTSATITSGNGTIPFSFNGTSGSTSDFARLANSSMCVNGNSNPTVQIAYNKHGFSDAKAWLNYITLNAWRNLIHTGNQMHFSNPNIKNHAFARHTIGNGNNLEVWDITDFLNPIRVQGSMSGSAYTFISEANTKKDFISFNGNAYLTPVFEGMVANQNLHALGQTDYIIISHPMFLDEAKKLGEFHKIKNNYSYVVVTPQQIYNEFSSGSQDISAIRDFLKMFYDRASNLAEQPKYLLMFGRASYNYKDKSQNNSNFVPTFQSSESLSPTRSYASDDFFGLLDDGEGFDCNGHLDIGIGRLPVINKQEAINMVNKIIRYHEKNSLANNQNNCNFISEVPNFADWRNVVTFVTDDGDHNYHFTQSEGLSNLLGLQYKHLNIDKIHLDAYPQISTPGGERAPLVNEAINRRILRGSLIVNYTGHGGESGWAHERILEISDINSWDNKFNMPLFITATCEFSRFDDPKNIAAGELVILNPNGGGIALFSTTRLAFANYNEMLNRSVYKVAFERPSGKYPTLGEIFAFSKTDNNSNLYMRNFILLGDPAMRLAYPEHYAITTKINQSNAGFELDTISAMSFVTIEGHIENIQGQKIQDFNGTIFPTVFDKPALLTTLASDPSVNSPVNYYLQNNILYKGKVSVVNGNFSFSFFVPKDINYSLGRGKISYYAENGQTDATGYFEDFYIGGPQQNYINDDEGPEIRLFLNDSTFINGATTDENPVLIAFLRDSTGINTLGSGIGHDIITILDGSGEVIVLNSYYEADLDSYQSGRVVYPFKNLSEGVHSLYFKAWDVLNNSSEAAISFIVAPSHEAVIKKLFNYPNPFNEYTDFIFEHNQSCNTMMITIDIFNNQGQHVRQLVSENTSLGYRTEPIRWNGTSSNGKHLPSGVYVYNVKIKTCEGHEARQASKLVIIK